MTTDPQSGKPRRRPHAVRDGLLMMAGLSSLAAAAATADISNEPLTSSSTASIRPNLMFMLDASGSMDYDYAPDYVGAYKYSDSLLSPLLPSATKLCFADAAINPIFYNPALTYKPPVAADGTPYPDSSFSSAWRDGFNTAAGTRDLRNPDNLSSPETQVGDGLLGIGAPHERVYYAKWKGTGQPKCNDSAYPGTYSYKNFDFVLDASGWTAAQKTNYANWYSYYRTRMLTMRSAAGRVFATIDPTRYRVGFSTIADTGATDGTGFLNIRDFDAAGQRSDFFSRLYGNAPNGGTPLRQALSKAGRYFAGELTGQVDPAQYSCQRNYTILSTDGYWNDSDSKAVQLDGLTRVGDQDGGSTPRPQLDANARSNTLADVAMYYYKNDLRSSDLGNCSVTRDGETVDVCANNVGRTATDTANWQHMNTITLGLGVDGTLAYDPDYENQTSGDYFAIRNGSKNWPSPSADAQTTIDDLWHAAVNGRGHYYSAKDPANLATGLTAALNSIAASKGSGTSASASNLRPVAGDNAIFIASYYSAAWDGNIRAQTVNPSTGEIDPAVQWNARAQLTAQSPASRNIRFFDAAAAGKLSAFTYANLSSAGKAASFDAMCPSSGENKLSQCLTLSATDKALITGARLVDFLRGDGTYEAAPSATSKLFRRRYNEPEGLRNVLGDIVSAAPVYVKQPKFQYGDAGYASFANTHKDRKGVVYAAANDGMLHAFDAATGNELWGYVPSMVMPKLHRLADINYATQHQFFVDAAPTAGDVKGSDGAWRTVLVGGLGAGGRGYYALDVTDPDNPKGLWEFTDVDLGLSFGNALLTKIDNGGEGRWVAIFASGYNNVSDGDGQGYLYVLDAITGTLIRKLPTGAGSSGTPSNLGRINGWVDEESNNLTETVYGGDLLGNVWRFDIGSTDPSSWSTLLLGQAAGPDGTPQSITVKPELTEIKVGAVKYRLVSVGTGRYLGISDIESSALQSVYVFKDTGSGLGVLRAAAGMVEQTLQGFTLTSGTEGRTVENPQAVDWSSDVGWFVDFDLTSGERVDVEMRQQLTRLNVATNAPDPNACSAGGAGGTSWLYHFDIYTGSFVATAEENMLAQKIDETTTAGLEVIQLEDGSTKTIVCLRDGECLTLDDPPLPSPASGLRRTSWRELVN